MTRRETPVARAPTRDIQTAMDRVLTTHGAYIPVELMARRRAGNRNGAIEALCLLCWRFPAAAETLLDNGEISDLTLHEAWIEFRDLDLNPPPETCLFPAWFLLAEPGLARARAADCGIGNDGGEYAFHAVRRLLDQDCIEARKAVRAAGPWLLEAYLQLHTCRVHGDHVEIARN